MNRYLIPLFLFICLVVLFRVGLDFDPRRVPSPLIDKPVPAFSLPELKNPDSTVGSDDLKGQVTLLNVWASWCIECRHEHPLLMELARKNNIRIYGLNYKDEREEAIRWLDRYGDPYIQTAFDLDGKTGIDLGVYGVPETFVVDRDGIIRYKFIGPITAQLIEETLMPLLERLEKQEAG